MKFVILALLVTYAFATMHPVNHEIVAEIKQKASWTAMEPEENPFAYMPIEQIKSMMGTKLESTLETSEYVDLGFEPNSEFDSRTEWPGKVHAIRDQGACGSCWAFGSSEALSDRFAIEGDDSSFPVLSPQYQVNCDSSNFGCQGGYLDKAWTFLAKQGTVTDSCLPYTSGTTGKEGSCPSTCANGNEEFTLYTAQNSAHPKSQKNIQQEIQKNGPVETGFMVYQDFMSYKSGVYHHTTGGFLGGHAVKIVGWGSESGTDYWIVANSWGTSWGEEGYFRIAVGDCGFEDQVYAGKAKTKKVSE